MSKEMMNTKEVATYFEIHEKQVYALIKEGKIPCTKAFGKWIFPKHIIDSWIEDKTRAGTGTALDIARKCQVDIAIVHAKELEDKLLQTDSEPSVCL
jgi:excisionase family DNA binding protein